jgi:hypothetical protein
MIEWVIPWTLLQHFLCVRHCARCIVYKYDTLVLKSLAKIIHSFIQYTLTDYPHESDNVQGSGKNTVVSVQDKIPIDKALQLQQKPK